MADPVAARIRGACQWAASDVDLDEHIDAIVRVAHDAHANGVPLICRPKLVAIGKPMAELIVEVPRRDTRFGAGGPSPKPPVGADLRRLATKADGP